MYISRQLTAPPVLASAIYEGVVVHHRYTPKGNAFRYRMSQLYLDLNEVEHIFEKRWLWSIKPA